ncbi:MAG TPA: lipocalin family protein [Chitinophagaceae bacterium]|jgi:hypothetical protein|nr:lipocalin family protein [Chitinophagaceae bacterium]
MKKYIFTPLLSLTLVLFALVSCDKDDDTPAPKTKTELITSGTWKFQSASAGGVDISTAPQIACFVDNTITFSSATAGSISEGAVICAPTTAGPFTWNFATGETELVLSGPLIPGGTNTFTIVSLNETNLVVSQNVNFPPPTLITITFKH